MQLAHENKPAVPRDRLIRLPQVILLVNCSKSTIYTMLAKGEFVKPVRLSSRMVAFSETAVLQWVQDRINAVSAS